MFIPDPGSEFFHPGSASKNLSILNKKNCFYALRNNIRIRNTDQYFPVQEWTVLQVSEFPDFRIWQGEDDTGRAAGALCGSRASCCQHPDENIRRQEGQGQEKTFQGTVTFSTLIYLGFLYFYLLATSLWFLLIGVVMESGAWSTVIRCRDKHFLFFLGSNLWA